MALRAVKGNVLSYYSSKANMIMGNYCRLGIWTALAADKAAASSFSKTGARNTRWESPRIFLSAEASHLLRFGLA